MRKYLLLSIALFLASPVVAQDIYNPQTDASQLTTGTLPTGRISGVYTGLTGSTAFAIGAGSAITSSGAGGALGTAAFKATGTTGNTVPLLDGTNTWSGNQTISVSVSPTLTIDATSGTPAITLGNVGGGGGIKAGFDYVISTGNTRLRALGSPGSGNVLSVLTKISDVETDVITVTFDGKVNLPTIASVATTSAVCVTAATGLLTYNSTVGTCTVSSVRFKTELAFGDPKTVLDLVPRRFFYKDGGHGWGERLGLFAEDVCKLDAALCVRNAAGQIENYDERGLMSLVIRLLKNQQAQITALKPAPAKRR